MFRSRLLPFFLTIAACGAAAPGGAAAATGAATSTNWSGYAVGRDGVNFRKVTGSWTVPTVSCTAGSVGYSANWVGLGGSSESSAALEQIGTDANCTQRGTAQYRAWSEIVPAAAHYSAMTIKAGDRMSASVTVVGHRTHLLLRNVTRGTKLDVSATPKAVDVSSAEWIVEAPSLCSSDTLSEDSCSVAPLANFTTTGFSAATATTTGGHTGPISDARWDAAAITLQPGEGRFARQSSGAGATPAALSADGRSFAVSFAAEPSGGDDGSGDDGSGGGGFGPPPGSGRPGFPGRR